MNSITVLACNSVSAGMLAYCKYLSANDTQVTGSHQSGIHIAHNAWPIMFDSPGQKGSNKDRFVTIRWQNDFNTESRFIYYGQKTRNEYRLTRMGRGFPFLQPEYIGSLFVLSKIYDDFYDAFILYDEDSINDFLDTFGIGPTETNRLIERQPGVAEEDEEYLLLAETAARYHGAFPASEIMSESACALFNGLRSSGRISTVDDKLIRLTDLEYKLFRAIEQNHYGAQISEGFTSMDDFVSLANQIINRRKSRAGKSFEHHLATLFTENQLLFEEQPVTEGNKRPDFIFPSAAAYHNPGWPLDQLLTLAAKTTCKDRWRQVLNEADRLRDQTKYLCTLQQGISPAQLDEMRAEKVILIVPAPYISAYPAQHRDMIWNLAGFISFVREKQMP